MTAVLGVALLPGGPSALGHHREPGPTIGPYYDNMFTTLNYPGPCVKDKICQSDNAGLSYYVSAAFSLTGQNNVKSVMTNQYNNLTDFTTRLESPPVESGGAETDIIFVRGTVPGVDIGMTACDDPIDSVKCDSFYVTMENTDPGLWIPCHEAGHAVGLVHGGDGSPSIDDNDSDIACMKRTVSSTVLGTHNISMINGTYS